VRYVAALLVALSGACKVVDLSGLGAPQGPHIELTTVAAGPTNVRAGGQLIATATATFGNCGEVAIISVNYAGQYSSQPGPAFQSPFTAVLSQTAVQFDVVCGTGTGSQLTRAPTRYVYITVAPAP
jgi:hypothetical protein